MKKKNVSKLKLQKRAISKLDHLRGGNWQVGNPVAAGTNVLSNCNICDSIRNTQCKGNDCPNFSVPCKDKATPVGAAQAAGV
ncbi:hypothetical protein [uncultured Kordia sp.]|uniref:hypothetical protein n=1 Tax=uncultured Kordia sp. TaxID=507699 RepID=UPI0026100BF8|nr:hypothetical protein [uncultured Kordia sp.]